MKVFCKVLYWTQLRIKSVSCGIVRLVVCCCLTPFSAAPITSSKPPVFDVFLFTTASLPEHTQHKTWLCSFHMCISWNLCMSMNPEYTFYFLTFALINYKHKDTYKYQQQGGHSVNHILSCIWKTETKTETVKKTSSNIILCDNVSFYWYLLLATGAHTLFCHETITSSKKYP